jgi:hypothetical protein
LEFLAPVFWSTLVSFLDIRRKAVDTLNDPAALDWQHFAEQPFRPLGCSAAQVALTAFGANKDASPSYLEAFGCRFMGLDLVLSSRLLAWHDPTPLT